MEVKERISWETGFGKRRRHDSISLRFTGTIYPNYTNPVREKNWDTGKSV
jgi:hypothetical protein